MARFRKITVQMWLGGSFQRLSPLKPCGQALWVYLLTNPDTVSIPGLYRAGEAGMAEALGWSLKDFRKAFGEVLREGMAKADWKARVVWIPKAVKHDPPQSPNAVKGWSKWLDEIPACPLKDEAISGLKAFVEGMGEAFRDAFPECYRQPLPIQDSGAGLRTQDSGRRKEEPLSADADAFDPIEVWNANRDGLPEVQVVNSDRRRFARRCIQASADRDAHVAAIRAFAADPFNREKGYGFDTYARKVAKWLDAGMSGPREDPFYAKLRAQEEAAARPPDPRMTAKPWEPGFPGGTV